MHARCALAMTVMLATATGAGAQQAAAATDWRELVARACEHPRYGMRLSLSRRVAQAGDEAVDAIRAHAREAALPLLLVDAIADAGTGGPRTLALLEEWARDRAFFWRSQALRGLADRALPAHEPLFRAALDDPSHLQRLQGARGLFLLGADREPARRLLADPDPRARARIAAFLLEHGDAAGLPEVARALQRRDAFLGDPWAQREATTALRALRAFAGEDFGLGAGAEPQPAAAFARLEQLVRERAPGAGDLAPPQVPEDHAGGIEIRSCRNGDLFLRWTAGGRIDFGLDATPCVELPAAIWEPLRASLPADAGDRTVGVVICDYLRAVSIAPALAQKCAPGELTDDLARWLKALAAGLEKSSGSELGSGLASRLEQFERVRRE